MPEWIKSLRYTICHWCTGSVSARTAYAQCWFPIEIQHQIEQNFEVTVIGLGPVGTVAAVSLAASGHEVLASDIDLAKGGPSVPEYMADTSRAWQTDSNRYSRLATSGSSTATM